MEEFKHCQGVHICLVGANQFQNDLLIYSMEKCLDCRCRFTQVASISELRQVVWETSDEKSLVYIDCYDLQLSELDELLSTLSLQIPRHALLALYNSPDKAAIEERALTIGVRGFFYAKDSPEEFCKGIRAILKGEIWISREKLSKMVLEGFANGSFHPHQKRGLPANLTPREKEILSLLAEGASNKDIAGKFHISVHTVRTHLHNIFRKIKVKTRIQATFWSLENL